MRKLTEVEHAKALMTESVEWGVWKWLSEKKRVRAAADHANDALDGLEDEVKAEWSDELKAAYNQLVDEANSSGNGTLKAKNQKRKKEQSGQVDPKFLAIAKRIFEADEEAERVRLDAEDIFDEAERRLSTSMAKEGSKKAIEAWILHEKAIRKAETAGKSE